MSERVSGVSERVSDVSELANGRASGPVLQSVYSWLLSTIVRCFFFLIVDVVDVVVANFVIVVAIIVFVSNFVIVVDIVVVVAANFVIVVE